MDTPHESLFDAHRNPVHSPTAREQVIPPDPHGSAHGSSSWLRDIHLLSQDCPACLSVTSRMRPEMPQVIRRFPVGRQAQSVVPAIPTTLRQSETVIGLCRRSPCTAHSLIV